MLARRGATLAELMIAISLAAVVLTAASGTFLRQRRNAADHAARARAESQLHAALAALQSSLEGVSPSAGDLVAGEARDTAMQLRLLVGSGVACDSGAGQATISADDTSTARASGFASAPRVGDTLWWRVSGEPSWSGRRVVAIATGVGGCPAIRAGPRPLLRLAFASPDTVPPGVPVRLTRQERYSFYRGGDGRWQLGISEWSDPLRAFAPPQPVAGPFALAAPDGTRTGMRYFEASGAELTMGPLGVPTSRVTRVRITVIAPAQQYAGARSDYHRDSLDVALGHAP